MKVREPKEVGKVQDDEAEEDGFWGTMEESVGALDRLALEGARRMLEVALEREVEAYLEKYGGGRDEQGRSLVVRNGRARERQVTTGAGTIPVRAPRVNDRRVIEGERQRFTSAILPPYLRRSRNVAEVLPALYLAGVSTSDFTKALPELFGERAALSASTIQRLTVQWQAEFEEWRKRPLSDLDYVYIWADGIHFRVRLDVDNIAALVVIGVRPDGAKEVIALEGGYRESTESWQSILRDLKRRGMRAPRLAIADGALGFWAALSEVFPETDWQRCWVHKIANILDKLPKRQQPRAKELLHEIMNAATRKDAEDAVETFESEFEARYPKACKSLTHGMESLFTFYKYPAEHWKHIRTTNPIESTFATVRHRQRQTKGAGSRQAGLAMAYKLVLAATAGWQRLTAAGLLEEVRAGVAFEDGLRPPAPPSKAAADPSSNQSGRAALEDQLPRCAPTRHIWEDDPDYEAEAYWFDTEDDDRHNQEEDAA